MSKRKLLLADDSITIQKVVNLTFADEGIEVISVGDGDSAMRKFDEFIPDLVMADVNMPGLSGYEVCSIIKCTEETQHIPVILLVGSFEPFDEERAKDAGADDFLTKPFQSIRQLVNKVTDLLNRRDQETAETPAETPVEEQAEATTEPVGDTFAETLKFETEQISPLVFEGRREQPIDSEARHEPPPEYGDAGMDDEMIEASSASDYLSDPAAHREEPAIDDGQTSPLNDRDLKEFEIVSGAAAEHRPETGDSFDYRETTEQIGETSENEPPSFEEEARKLQASSEHYEAATEDRPEISETEPQLDYHLPEESGFEKEITDAETLEPEVSYSEEEPRTADFSQAPAEESTETDERAETGAEIEEPGAEAAESGNEPEAFSPETSLAEETRLREVAEGAEAMPEAEIDLSDNAVREESESATPTEAAEAVEEEAETAEKFENAEEAEPAEETVAAEETIASEEFEEAEKPETVEAAETTEDRTVSTAAHIPPFDFDEGDLLELPPLVEETGIRPPPKTEPLVPEVLSQPAASEPESKITVTKTIAESEIALTFPPELIEAIANKVAEKISAKTMTEVLPQITELVMKKMAEERKE